MRLTTGGRVRVRNYRWTDSKEGNMTRESQARALRQNSSPAFAGWFV